MDKIYYAKAYDRNKNIQYFLSRRDYILKNYHKRGYVAS